MQGGLADGDHVGGARDGEVECLVGHGSMIAGASTAVTSAAVVELGYGARVADDYRRTLNLYHGELRRDLDLSMRH